MRSHRFLCLSLVLFATVVAAQTMEDAGRLYEKGDYKGAVAVLEKMSGQGNAEAQYELGAVYMKGVAGVPQNTAKGIALWESAAAKGLPIAQFVLGTELFKGQLVARDPKRGMSLLQASAKQKYGAAQFSLCMEMSADDGPFYDAVEAYAWCKAAAMKPTRVAERAGVRVNETLGKIMLRQGVDAVQIAKVRAAKYEKDY